MLKTNPDSRRSCPCFRVFRLNFASDFFNLLLVRSSKLRYVMKHVTQGRSNRLGWVLNHQPCDHGRHKSDAPNHWATLPTKFKYSALLFGVEVLTRASLTSPSTTPCV